jgi:hypothetical protein
MRKSLEEMVEQVNVSIDQQIKSLKEKVSKQSYLKYDEWNKYYHDVYRENRVVMEKKRQEKLINLLLEVKVYCLNDVDMLNWSIAKTELTSEVELLKKLLSTQKTNL